MKYRAIISVDWGKPHKPPRQQELITALVDSGWRLAETTALSIQTVNLAKIWRGIELVSRAATRAGTLTSLNFNIVASDNFGKSRKYAASKNHPSAVAKILAQPLPAPYLRRAGWPTRVAAAKRG